MSTPEPSKCCVCGGPTTKRCQACAKSGIDLFFCSPEHQKLVWKHHKQVCGPNAHPFCPPPLTDEELRDVATHARDSRPKNLERLPPQLLSLMQRQQSVTATGFSPIADLLERSVKAPPGSFETLLLPMLRDPAKVTDRQTRYLLLTKARAFLLAHLENFVGTSTGNIYEHTIWAQVARLAACTVGWLGEDRNEADMRRVSQINHQVLVLVTIAQIKHADDSAIPDTWVLRSFEQLVDLFANIKPFESAPVLDFVTNYYRSRIAPLADRTFIAVPKPGGRGLTLRYPD